MIKRTLIIDGDEVRQVQEREYPSPFDEAKGYLFWARKSFAKSFHGVDFPEEMSDMEIGRMARLAKRIWSNTNMLGYRGNGGVRPYTVEMIADILKMSTRQAYRFVEKMIRLGILAKVKVDTRGTVETSLYVNPIYFCSTSRIPLNLYLIFRKQFDEVLPAWVLERYRSSQDGKEEVHGSRKVTHTPRSRARHLRG
ncbi:MAG: hypothetical protein M0P69_08195 [Bacteroidales bacterium]|jgi:hypothetical protein|nr:hypothetical protein [Bacteroidales bacterium]